MRAEVGVAPAVHDEYRAGVVRDRGRGIGGVGLAHVTKAVGRHQGETSDPFTLAQLLRDWLSGADGHDHTVEVSFDRPAIVRWSHGRRLLAHHAEYAHGRRG